MKNKTKWFKHCPVCNRIQYYQRKRNLERAIKNNSKCKKCYKVLVLSLGIGGKKNLGKKHSHKVNMLKGKKGSDHWAWGLKRSDDVKAKISKKKKGTCCGANNHFFGKHHTKESNQKNSNAHKGKKLSEKHKNKIRVGFALSNREKYGRIFPNYNKNACLYFELLNNWNDWNLQHAENGGEYIVKGLGYFLDAIDFENKIIIEYDEPRHFLRGELKSKDVIRQEKIQKIYEDFKFIRVREGKNNGKYTVRKYSERKIS